mmetsp:Transcript_8836/g.18120  ORF Transcript_8836/g.18120 Transcript_8836/m.18120 type:complete len:206 (+) Transcript_8836:8-625(+)
MTRKEYLAWRRTQTRREKAPKENKNQTKFSMKNKRIAAVNASPAQINSTVATSTSTFSKHDNQTRKYSKHQKSTAAITPADASKPKTTNLLTEHTGKLPKETVETPLGPIEKSLNNLTKEALDTHPSIPTAVQLNEEYLLTLFSIPATDAQYNYPPDIWKRFTKNRQKNSSELLEGSKFHRHRCSFRSAKIRRRFHVHLAKKLRC